MKRILQRWLTPKAQLTSGQAERLATWQALPVSRDAPRCVVLDVETTGLNLVTDTLISIGSVAVVDQRIVLSDSYAVVLQQHTSSHHDNILIHGISGSAQREGVLPADALLDFLEFVGKDPLVAFHVAFDETMIRKAMKAYLGFNFRHTWLDLAYVMPALYPTLMYTHRVLDDWTQHFNIINDSRHNALADALATSQLLLVAQCHNASRLNYHTLRDMERELRHSKGEI